MIFYLHADNGIILPIDNDLSFERNKNAIFRAYFNIYTIMHCLKFLSGMKFKRVQK